MGSRAVPTYGNNPPSGRVGGPTQTLPVSDSRVTPADRYDPGIKSDQFARTYVAEVIDVCPVDELGPGDMRLVEYEELEIGVFNCAGTVYAIEDRCSHDNGPLVEGELDQETCTIECPRHGSQFDLKTGQPKTLPAYLPVETFPVIIENETIKVEVE
jgi:3-phenylpropionate/trans-cinnamate dioxygenase ferredoxin subunit